MAQKKGMRAVKERAVAAFSRGRGLMAQKGNTHGKGRLSTTCSHLSLKLTARLSTREIKILEKKKSLGLWEWASATEPTCEDLSLVWGDRLIISSGVIYV